MQKSVVKSRIENIMVIAFVSALIGGFIYTILNMIEKVEEISVEVRIRQLQSAVKWKFSELMLDSDLSKIKKYNGANPFVWISFNATIEDKSNHKNRKKKDNTNYPAAVNNQPQHGVEEEGDLGIDNYLGSLENYRWSEIPTKSWFFDKKEGWVIYKVAYPDRLVVTGLIKDRLAWRLKLETIQEQDPLGKGEISRPEALKLLPVYPYFWGNKQKK